MPASLGPSPCLPGRGTNTSHLRHGITHTPLPLHTWDHATHTLILPAMLLLLYYYTHPHTPPCHYFTRILYLRDDDPPLPPPVSLTPSPGGTEDDRPHLPHTPPGIPFTPSHLLPYHLPPTTRDLPQCGSSPHHLPNVLHTPGTGTLCPHTLPFPHHLTYPTPNDLPHPGTPFAT